MGHTDPMYGEYGVVGAKLLIGSKDAVFFAREIQVFRYVIRTEEIFHENSCCRCFYRFIYGIDF